MVCWKMKENMDFHSHVSIIQLPQFLGIVQYMVPFIPCLSENSELYFDRSRQVIQYISGTSIVQVN